MNSTHDIFNLEGEGAKSHFIFALASLTRRGRTGRLFLNKATLEAIDKVAGLDRFLVVIESQGSAIHLYKLNTIDYLKFTQHSNALRKEAFAMIENKEHTTNEVIQNE